ncbi:protein trapped in endoderm-1 isoform X2 [Procambarus clarkii]|uniref:protein trapped in endoderm-1 isoform X2 n=1 Tax=Procambarus clarkii TaxID=6728 RepID=UPI003742D83D
MDSTSSTAESATDKVPDWAIVLTAVAAVIISILGFFGNLLTILALPYPTRLRNAATYLVVNLAVAEGIFCVTILPISAAHLFTLYMTSGKPLFDDRGCNVFVFLRYVNIQAELLSIAAIAVNRCVLIAIPKQYPRLFSGPKTAGLIAAIWLVSGLVMTVPLLEARQSSSKMQSNNSLLKNGASSSDPRLNKPRVGLRTRDIRIARTIGVIFLAFMICCTPVSIAHYFDSKMHMPTLLLLLHPLYWAQYCINIFIYVFMNNQYRDAYVNYISRWWPNFKEVSRKTLKWKEEATSDNSRRPSRAATPNTSSRFNVRKISKCSLAKITNVETPGTSNEPPGTPQLMPKGATPDLADTCL